MPDMCKEHLRKSIRLQSYDYSQAGAYYFTTNIKRKDIILANIVEGKAHLTNEGKIVQECWLDLPNHYQDIFLDSYSIMPDHFHGIIVIVELGEKEKAGKRETSLSEIIRAFKSFSAKKINYSHQTSGKAVWQRNYYEHVIKNETDWRRITDYILTYPLNWERGELNHTSNFPIF